MSKKRKAGAPSIVVMSQQAQGKDRYLGFWAAKARWVIHSRSSRTYTSDVDEPLAAIVSAIAEIVLEAFIVNHRRCPGPRFQTLLDLLTGLSEANRGSKVIGGFNYGQPMWGTVLVSALHR